MRILVAEDEKDIRTTYCSVLEKRGHEVILTSDGEDCLAVYTNELRHKKQRIQEMEIKYYIDHNGQASSSSSSLSPFDLVILDYRMPKKDGLQVAKEIFKINPMQRIIFASAYVKETLEESVKELQRVVEMLQKPFSLFALVDTVENREAYEGLKMLMATAKDIVKEEDFYNPSSDQIRELFEGLRRVQKFKGF
jgi:CheY-like chemotaxis protein